MQNWDSVYFDLSLSAKLIVAAFLSAILGWERETKNRPAGLRTHMIVGMSAALFMCIGRVLSREMDHVGNGADMLRVLEAVVKGISFLGAGTIFFARGRGISGLTTAASILATAGVGMTVGIDHYVLAVCTTGLLLLVLAVVRMVTPRAEPQS